MISLVSGSLVMYTVRPTADEPLPDVYIPLGQFYAHTKEVGILLLMGLHTRECLFLL
jgi:hypothetical protein